jgi:hypothetical protein
MVWSEYVEYTNDYHHGEMDYDSEQEEVLPPSPMDLEDWITWYSRDLMNMWFSLKQYREDSGISNYVMNFSTYSDFCEYCYKMSDGTRNSYPS